MSDSESSGELPMINFDELLPERKKSTQHPLVPQFQFGCCMVGKTGTGKTNLLLNLLMKQLGDYDSCHCFLKDVTEDKYVLLGKFFEKVKRSRKKFQFLISDKIEDIPDPNSFDPKGNHIMVFDDLVNTKEAQQYIAEFAIRGRKRGVSFFYLSQRLYDIPRMIRDNVTYLILWKTDKRTVAEFYKTYGVDVDIEQWYKMFNFATKGKHDFFMLDLKTSDPKLIYRKNLDHIDLISL